MMDTCVDMKLLLPRMNVALIHFIRRTYLPLLRRDRGSRCMEHTYVTKATARSVHFHPIVPQKTPIRRFEPC